MCGIFVFINSGKQGGSSMQEKSKIKKEKWGKPMLTVLVRGDGQERVVDACKGNGSYISSNYDNVDCEFMFGGCFGGCSVVGSS